MANGRTTAGRCAAHASRMAAAAGMALAAALMLGAMAPVARGAGQADPEYEKFAQALESAMQQRKADFFDAAVDTAALKEAIMAGDTDRAFWAQALVGLPKQLKLGQMIVQRMGAHGAYRFLRLLQRDGSMRALFRLNGPTGLNYHELILIRKPDGQVRIADMYVMVSGELLSQTIRRTVKMAAEESRGREMSAAMQKARSMRTQLAAGKAAAALATYQSLPQWLQNEKWVQMLRLEAAGKAGRKEYETAAEDFRRRFGDDPAADLSAAVVYDSQKQYDRALEAINRLDKRIGGDPYLDFMKGLTLAARGDTQQGTVLLNAALEREPTLYEAYEVLIKLAMRQNDPETAVRTLERAQRNGVPLDAEKERDLAELVKTPEYVRWKQRRSGEDIH